MIKKPRKKPHPLQKVWWGINERARKDGVGVVWRSYKEFSEWAYSIGWTKGIFVCRIDRKSDWGPENCCLRTLAENNGYGDSVHRLPDGRRIRDILGYGRLGHDNRKHNIITHRVFRSGWSVEQALNTDTLSHYECWKLSFDKKRKENT